MDPKLLELFFRKYTTKKETGFRLPISIRIDDFWPEELAYRKAHAEKLPLKTAAGDPFWWVLTEKTKAACDAIAWTALADQDADILLASEEAMTDEAYYSSTIEGADTTPTRLKELVRKKITPKEKSERMAINNYQALRFVLDHLEDSISLPLIEEIGILLTEGTLDPEAKSGFRDGPVYVQDHLGRTVYVGPPAEQVLPMMEQLVTFLSEDDVHPLVKACIVHVYFVTVHPFFDGNGRTARALSYMVLLQSGYDIFRRIPISALLLQERSQYYRAIQAVQNPQNGNDMTYFIEFYADLLARSCGRIAEKLAIQTKLRALSEKLPKEKAARLLDGAAWLLEDGLSVITTDQWSKRLSVSFETARTDLQILTAAEFLQKRIAGHRHYYDVKC